MCIHTLENAGNCRFNELSTVANQICDGITSATAADQSQLHDDVAMTTSEVPPAMPDAPLPTPGSIENVENVENSEIIPTESSHGEIIDVNGVVITPEEMDLAQLKVRVVCQEKANMALRMELKCAELQVTINFSCQS